MLSKSVAALARPVAAGSARAQIKVQKRNIRTILRFPQKLRPAKVESPLPGFLLFRRCTVLLFSFAAAACTRPARGLQFTQICAFVFETSLLLIAPISFCAAPEKRFERIQKFRSAIVAHLEQHHVEFEVRFHSIFFPLVFV